MKSQEVRAKFLEFFKSKEHLIVPSAQMVVKDDPTLMFVNSGMAPFKEYFLGNAKPKSNPGTGPAFPCSCNACCRSCR